MNELTIIDQNGKQVIDSREVAGMVEKPHKDLLKAIRKYCEYISNGRNFSPVDFFIESSYLDSKGESRPCYLLTKKGCDLVANKMTGEKGILFTASYVTAFEKMRETLQPKLPTTYKEALQQLLVQVEENEKLQLENKEMKPKAEFFDAVADSKTAIQMGEVAKVLDMGIGRNKLFEILRRNKVLMNNNIPYQKYIDSGYFRVVETKFTKPDGDTCVNIKTLVYQKGINYIKRLVEEKGGR